MSNLKFSFVGKHAQDLHDGRMVVPGQEVTLTATEAKEPHNARLIEEGQLLPHAAKADKPKEGDA